MSVYLRQINVNLKMVVFDWSF